MSRRESSAVERAVAAVVERGESQMAAAREAGVNYSSLTRALRRRGIAPLGPRPRAPHLPAATP
jgi:hypothetical protein